MKTSLSHLPETKREQITQVAAAIEELFHPQMIILFGSYAKGTYVEDSYTEAGTIYEYVSDYDFLVVMENEAIKDYLIRDRITNRFHFHTPINIISHTIDYVNQGLAFGQYFFTDIVNEGIMLYNSADYRLVEPKQLSADEEKRKAQDYFEIWFEIANEFLIDGGNAYARRSYKKAAFELHQAAEGFFNTTLLVFTGYKPKTHNLDKLRSYVKGLSEELFMVFLNPRFNFQNERHLFDLLKRGYIDARYKQEYYISENEAAELLSRLNYMKEIVEALCRLKIASL
jgi:HEPN domain-containing protein/predicted nucleotidyltransferase